MVRSPQGCDYCLLVAINIEQLCNSVHIAVDQDPLVAAGEKLRNHCPPLRYCQIMSLDDLGTTSSGGHTQQMMRRASNRISRERALFTVASGAAMASQTADAS